MELTIEITKYKSLCCNSRVHYRNFKDGDYSSSEPFCSKCLLFPKSSRYAILKAKAFLYGKKLYLPRKLKKLYKKIL